MVARRERKAKAPNTGRRAPPRQPKRPSTPADTPDDARAQQFVAFFTHAALALHRNAADARVAAGVNALLTKHSVAAFLDAMLVALCVDGDTRVAPPQLILSRLTAASRKRVCGTIFSADEIAYSCRNCQVDSTCVICKDCFMLGDHEGHDVYFQRTTAGSSCDCGDIHAWKRSGFCSRHPGAEDDGEGTSGQTTKRSNLPEGLAAMAPVVVDAAVEFVYQVYLGIDHGFEFAEALELFTHNIPSSVLSELSAQPSRGRPTPTTSPALNPVIPTTTAESQRRPRQSRRRTEEEEPQTSDTIPAAPPRSLEQLAIRLHNDDVHSLGEVINELCIALDCGKLSARATVNEADRHGDAIVAKTGLLKCAFPVGHLVRESLNVSVAPVWWERQMENVPAILEWLRAISAAADGLYEIVSEALRKKRRRRMAPPSPVSGSVKPGAFWKDQSIRIHSAAQAMITCVTGEESDIQQWTRTVEKAVGSLYRLNEDDTNSTVALPVQDEDKCENVMILEFVKAVSLSPAYSRHQSVRNGCTSVISKYLNPSEPKKVPHPSLLGLMVRWDCALRKRTAHLGHALLREHMLNKAFRKCMLEVYATSYGPMTRSYLKGLGNSTDSIFDFAVQFLTVPHLVKEYTRSEAEKDPTKPQLAYELLAALEKVMSSAGETGRNQDGGINVDHPALGSQKYKHCIDDLEYVFNVGAMPNELVCDERNLQLWLSSLEVLQNGDAQQRRGIDQSHVEYESDSWLSMFNLGIRVHSIFPVAWNGMTPELLAHRDEVIRRIFQRVISASVNSSRELNMKTAVKNIVPVKVLRGNECGGFNAYNFNVAASPTSLHVPLHRFLASSMRHVAVNVTWLHELLESNGLLAMFALESLPTADRIELIELPLRSLVMSSQIHSNLWRRNGEENMMAQLYNYSALPYCVHYRDADVFMLQVGIALLGADTILSLMVDRFQLGQFVIGTSPGTSIDKMGYQGREAGVDDQQQLQMMEEFLRLVIVLGTNLPSTVGEAYENLFLEEEMLQHLCAKSSSFSKLFDVAILPTGQDDVSVPRLEEVLAKVANFSPPSGLEPGRYELKDGFLEAYDPYFLHLNREAHEMARDRWTSYRKSVRQKEKAQQSSPVAPLKRMRRPLSYMQKPREILTCESTLTIVHTILWKVAKDESSSNESGASSSISDAVISTTLHLLVYGVYAAEEADEIAGTSEQDPFWSAVSKSVETFDGTSILALLWTLSNAEESSESLLDDEQVSTLKWLVWKLRLASKSCAASLKQLEKKNQQADQVSTADNGSADASNHQPTLEERKEEARKRALEAMARQQAAFQAMMASMGDDDDDEDLEGDEMAEVEDDSNEDPSTLGKRRASTESNEAEVAEPKRPRLANEAAIEDDTTCYKCILCHDTSNQGEMGVAAYVHQSTVLSGTFRPEPEEGLQASGAMIRKRVKELIEKMDLCSGGPNVSSNSSSPAFRALAAQFPDWYMDEGFDDGLILDPQLPHLMNTPTQRQIRHGANANRERGRGQQDQPALEAFLLNPDDDLDVLEGVLDLQEDQRLFPMPIHGADGPDRRDRGAQRPPGADRGIVVARRRGPDAGGDDESDFDDEDDFDDHQHRHHHHHHHDHHHRHDHSPRRPRASSNVDSEQLYLTPCGLHIRTCQHAVHIHCLERYIRSLHDKAIRGEDFDGVQAIDPDSAMTQFLCPLCKTLCNFLIPTSDPAGGPSERVAVDMASADQDNSSWHEIVDKQLKVPGWYRAVLGRDGDYGENENDVHDLWRDYFEETLWEPHGSLEKGAPFLWSACAFSLASFLNVAEHEFASERDMVSFEPLTDQCPASVEKEFESLIAVTKFCRWSFSLLEHSEDAKVIWETAKRCNPINTETKREYRKFTKVLGSIDACLRGTILGLLVADTFTAFVVSSVIADSPSTIWQFIPVFSAADLLQRVYAEFFVQSKNDERSLLQDKFSIIEELPLVVPVASSAEGSAEASASEEKPTDRRRSSRQSARRSVQTEAKKPAVAKRQTKKSATSSTKTAREIIEAMQANIGDDTSEQHAVLALVNRILNVEPEEKLKPLTKKEIADRVARIKANNGVLMRRMKLFWRCLSDSASASPLEAPTFAQVASCPMSVFEQTWKWCVDRINSKSFLGIAKHGDKCEHAEGCGEGYIASMFILRDQVTRPRLIDLPVQYDVLYSMMSGRKCTRCSKTPCDPGICLICGEFLCCGDSCCTRPFVNHGPQVGECTRHAAECGGGIGIVLMLDQCRVAIIGGSMAAHFPCPYVDAHGEEDVGLQRGRPLRLDLARYKYLESLWVNHRIFAEVSRQRNQRDPQYTINLSYL